MPRFFVDAEDIGESSLLIKDADAYHIARSLRMAVGDEVTVSDGRGCELLCRLTRIRDEECECEITSRSTCPAEMPVEVTLYMAYPKGDKLETVIQKAVELGASRIVPFESSRCIKRPKAEKIDKQLARLCRIAEEAAKQCGRGRIPEVTPPMSFAEAIRSAASADLPLFCYENEKEGALREALEQHKDARTVSVIVGSEGGFSPEEASAAVSAGCLPISLGRRILRCETAPSFVLSVISYVFEL